MSKKTMKIISIITILLCVIMAASTCFAELDPKNINGKDSKTDVNAIGNIGNSIATIIRNVGIVAAVIILMVLGIKYMMGSAEEKAEYKKTMIPYLVGAIVLFAASAIATAVITFSNSVGNSIG